MRTVPRDLDGGGGRATATRPLPPHVYVRLARARRLIDEGYERPPRLDVLARTAGFSRFHFIRLFRRAFRATPYQYLLRRRIERAKLLLGQSRLSVTAVCLDVGFESLGSFSRRFRHAVGTSPRDYRVRAASTAAARARVPACFLTMFGVREPGAPSAGD